MLLKDRVALVTGAGSGIGAGVAELFARHGARVYSIDVNGAAAEAAAAAIRSEGGFAAAFAADVRNSEMLKAVVDDAMARFGRIDVLINNAGIYPRHSFFEMTEQQWDEMQDVNLKGMFRLAKLVLPHMAAQRSGHVVNISSVTFFVAPKNLSHYIASKGGVIGLTRALAREMGEYDVHVNCITPGAVETEGEKLLNPPKEQIDAIVGLQSLKRRILPLDIARVCLFLSSELSDGMTGQTLNVDGGWVMY
jgi:3-oxoacyl-[acyl-carrier protein] reductase